jgi:hypothetical protein
MAVRFPAAVVAPAAPVWAAVVAPAAPVPAAVVAPVPAWPAAVVTPWPAAAAVERIPGLTALTALVTVVPACW